MLEDTETDALYCQKQQTRTLRPGTLLDGARTPVHHIYRGRVAKPVQAFSFLKQRIFQLITANLFRKRPREAKFAANNVRNFYKCALCVYQLIRKAKYKCRF